MTTPSWTPCAGGSSSWTEGAWSGTRLEGSTAMALRLDYYFKETFQGLKRNGLVAFAAVSTAFIALFLLGFALLAWRQARLLIQYANADVEVSVFLNDNINPEVRTHINQILAGMPEVSKVDYESKEEAFARARDVIFKNEPEVIRNISPDA